MNKVFRIKKNQVRLIHSLNRIYYKRSKEAVLALAGEISAGFPDGEMVEPNFEGLVRVCQV